MKLNNLFQTMLLLAVSFASFSCSDLTDSYTLPPDPRLGSTSYTVTYDSQGGNAVDGQTVLRGGYVINPSDPINSYYTFAGWFEEPACINAWVFTSNRVTADITLYAKWTLDEFTVVFDSQGGDAVAAQSVYNGSSAVEPVAPLREGHTFGGWFTESGCTTQWNFSSDTVTANMTLFAKWTTTQYSVTFDKNDTGAAGTMANQPITYGVSTNLTLNGFAKSDHTFVGWAASPSGEVVYADGGIYTMGAGNATLFAKWTVNQYSVTFDKNDTGAAGTMANQPITYGVSTNLTLNGFAKSDHTFVGWAASPSGEVVYADGGSYTMGAFNVTLYAKWTINEYSVTFNKNDTDATGTMANQPIAYGVSANLTLNGFAKSGYTFAGWAASSTGEVVYADGGIYMMGAGNVTLFAKWTSASKAITSFSFTSLAVTGIITGTNIAVTVPFGTNVTALVAAFSTTGFSVKVGSAVQTSGTTANDFTSPVVYTVTAANATTQDYTVTVTVAPAQFVISGTGGTAGNNQSFTYATLVFNMKYVPGGTFPTGTGTHTLPGESGANPATVSVPYWMAETEVTYELWYAVRTWAKANGYTLNANPGREGHDGIISAGAGAAPTPAKQEPVTTMNWREAMVWCNALTEYYNANNGTDPDLDVVYYTDSGYTTPIRTATDTTSITWTSEATPNGTQDNPHIKPTAKGFRLPGSMEWECAARYKDGTNWTAGTFASGATADYNNATATGLVAWYSANSGSSTKNVKGKTANALGLYDMSGNAREWCFDWHPSYVGSARVSRGGSWNFAAGYLQVGYVRDNIPYYVFSSLGFRFVRTQ